MLVRHLELEEFRCFRHFKLEFPRQGLRLVGPNGSGKTSILEALYLLATTKSFRSSLDRSLIHAASGQEFSLPPSARLCCTMEAMEKHHTLEIVLTIDPTSLTGKKHFRRDRGPVKALDFVGTLQVVLFSPNDLDLVTGSPQGRRRYLDVVLSTTDRTYLSALAHFSRVLEHRNSLLKQVVGEEGKAVEEQLAFWDEELLRHGTYVIVERLRFLATWEEELRYWFEQLTAGRLLLAIEYVSTVPLPRSIIDEIKELTQEEAQALVLLRYRTALEQHRREELRRGMTLFGPHRDDFTWLLGGQALETFGSRGLVRLAILAAKLAEMQVLFRRSGEWPVLLFDDAFSELDRKHRAQLLKVLEAVPAQKVVSAVDESTLDEGGLADLPLIRLENGEVSEWGKG